jgi:hypothetical protein
MRHLPLQPLTPHLDVAKLSTRGIHVVPCERQKKKLQKIQPTPPPFLFTFFFIFIDKIQEKYVIIERITIRY